MATLKVTVLSEGVHSGDASGIVPSSFRIIRQLLDRIENAETGEIIEDFQVKIPPLRYEELYNLGNELAYKDAIDRFPKVEGMNYVSQDCFQSFVNNTWKPYLEVTGGSLCI